MGNQTFSGVGFCCQGPEILNDYYKEDRFDLDDQDLYTKQTKAVEVDLASDKQELQFHQPNADNWVKVMDVPPDFFTEEMKQVYKGLKKLENLEIIVDGKQEFVLDVNDVYQNIQKRFYYLGQWRFGKPHGVGKIYFIENLNDQNDIEIEGEKKYSEEFEECYGDYFEGQIREGICEGKGRRMHFDGSYYEGEFTNGEMTGLGKFVSFDNTIIQGQFIKELAHGQATQMWQDGSSYTGTFINGIKEGKGKFIWAQKEVKKSNRKKEKEKPIEIKHEEYFEGEIKNNTYHGKGVYQWTDGRKYDGYWKKGKMHGKGIFIWKDGRKYEGEYKYDQKHGIGTMYWNDGRYFKGKWKCGLQSGDGVLYKTVEGDNGEERTLMRYGVWEEGKLIKWVKEEFQNNFVQRISNAGNFLQ